MNYLFIYLRTDKCFGLLGHGNEVGNEVGDEVVSVTTSDVLSLSVLAFWGMSFVFSSVWQRG